MTICDQLWSSTTALYLRDRLCPGVTWCVLHLLYCLWPRMSCFDRLWPSVTFSTVFYHPVHLRSSVIDADWCWLILIVACWCCLMLIDSDCRWMILTHAICCWLRLIDSTWFWFVLIWNDWFRLILIGADRCLFVADLLFLCRLCWLKLFEADWFWLMFIGAD